MTQLSELLCTFSTDKADPSMFENYACDISLSIKIAERFDICERNGMGIFYTRIDPNLDTYTKIIIFNTYCNYVNYMANVEEGGERLHNVKVTGGELYANGYLYITFIKV